MTHAVANLPRTTLRLLTWRVALLAWVDDVDGRKRIVRGTCTLDGVTMSEAKGLFIAPRADDDDYLARLGMAP